MHSSEGRAKISQPVQLNFTSFFYFFFFYYYFFIIFFIFIIEIIIAIIQNSNNDIITILNYEKSMGVGCKPKMAACAYGSGW